MSHTLVSVLAEVTANCYFSEHFQFSTSPDTESLSVAHEFKTNSSLVEISNFSVGRAEFKCMIQSGDSRTTI